MTEYNVYGLGNALADIEFEISVDRLQELKIEKGVMTLIDADRQHEILDRLSDLSPKLSCGGSAANTAIAISQFGGHSFYSCKVANDETGQVYLEDLIRNGVDSNLLLTDRPDGVTGKCIVFVTPDADRTMNTHLGISAEFSPEELVPEAIVKSQYLYVEGYLVTSPTGRAAAIRACEIAREAGVKTSLSLSDPNMAEFFKDGLLEMIGSGMDFIFSNESEALKLAKTEDMSEAIAYLKSLAKGFAITRGPSGSLIFDGEEMLEIPPVKVEAIDTVGAGDMYAGAFLYGITNGMNFTQAGNLASRAAAKLVTSFGPRLHIAETRKLLEVG
ncbi:MAG TPA: adenosine kinase [Oscillatoriales cyanobacterium M59_W2019_021]|nr:MAG: adenosine kinase [Cyanobacteria bacterium J055]HIK30547.1 adenosine kinase [Oscillatoriales cyanobacterium M4454_W2019_049]HIK50492.1 adenosine kinase [Oscillatoriales cyanobacterium M59_W2019_021]